MRRSKQSYSNPNILTLKVCSSIYECLGLGLKASQISELFLAEPRTLQFHSSASYFMNQYFDLALQMKYT